MVTSRLIALSRNHRKDIHHNAPRGLFAVLKWTFKGTRVPLVPDAVGLPPWFVRELTLLGLAGIEFTPEELVQRLKHYLGIEIRVCPVRDGKYLGFREEMLRNGQYGAVVRNPETQEACILVPDSLAGIERHLLIYHECAHVAAGHPLPPTRLYGPPSACMDQPWTPTKRLASAEPPTSESACEADAKLRARLSFKAGLYGPGLLDPDEAFFSTSNNPGCHLLSPSLL